MFFPWKNDFDNEMYSSNVYKGILKVSQILQKYANYTPGPYVGGRQRNRPPYYNGRTGNYRQPPYNSGTPGGPPPPYNNGTQGGYHPPYNNGAPGGYQPPYSNGPAGNCQPPHTTGYNGSHQPPPSNPTAGGYGSNMGGTPYRTERAGFRPERVSARKQRKQQRAKEEEALKNDPNMMLVRKKSLIPIIVSALFWIIFALPQPFAEMTYKWYVFGVLTLLSVGLFFLLGKIFKGKKMWVAKPIEPIKTGNPDIDKMFEDGKAYLTRLRNADIAIEDAEISSEIVRMEEVTKNIFAFIKDNPKKAPQIRKFMNYYLPTTLKLLDSYHKLSLQGVQGENISSAMFNIKGMMHTIVIAFEKQLDHLFQDEAMDISADISVMEGMLSQEGLGGSDFDADSKNKERK